jgi:hypothetical protein
MKNKFFLIMLLIISFALIEYGCNNKEKEIISKEIHDLAINYGNLIRLESELPSSVLHFRISELDTRKSMITFIINSNSPMRIVGFQGNISILNQYQDKVDNINVEISESIPPKGNIIVSYNYKGPVFNYKLTDMRCNFKIRTLNFEDGYSYKYNAMESVIHEGIQCCSSPADGSHVYDLDIEGLLACKEDALKLINDQKSLLKKYYDYQ